MKPRALLALLAVLVIWLAVALVGRASAREAEQAAIAKMHDANARTALLDLRANRLAKDSARLALLDRDAATGRTSTRVDRARDTLRSALTDAREALADVTADTARLRASLGVLTVAVERYDARVVALQDTVSSLRTSLSRFQLKVTEAEAKADAAIRALEVARDAWKGAATCKVLFIKCPTRTQAFIGGAVVTAAVIVAVR